MHKVVLILCLLAAIIAVASLWLIPEKSQQANDTRATATK